MRKQMTAIHAGKRMIENRRKVERVEMGIKTARDAEDENNRVVNVKQWTVHATDGRFFVTLDTFDSHEYREVKGISCETPEAALKDAMQMAVACWGNVNVIKEYK